VNTDSTGMTFTHCVQQLKFTSALLGIAIDKGYIKSIDETVFDFFPEDSDLIPLSPNQRESDDKTFTNP